MPRLITHRAICGQIDRPTATYKYQSQLARDLLSAAVVCAMCCKTSLHCLSPSPSPPVIEPRDVMNETQMIIYIYISS